MDSHIIAALFMALQEMEKPSISRKVNQMDFIPYVKKNTQRFKIQNPKLKTGHPIIQPRGQNH